MKIYLETAKTQEIQETVKLGILDGVTTNSFLISKEGRGFYEKLLEICHLVDIPISVGVLSVEEKTMVKEGEELAALHKNIIVKFPLTLHGLRATKRLTDLGVRVSVTLCRTPAQALLAAKAGAWSVSPIVHWCESKKFNDMGLVCHIVNVFRIYPNQTQVLLPNVRDPSHIIDSALIGNHICSMRFGVLKHLVIPPFMKNDEHPLCGLRTSSR